MEFLLQQALVRRGQDGENHTGFKSLDEIGGEFDPSDAYNVIIETDDDGKPTNKIKDEARYHLSACARYILSDILPETIVRTDNKIKVKMY